MPEWANRQKDRQVELVLAVSTSIRAFALEDQSAKVVADKPDQSEGRPASSDPDDLSDGLDNSPVEANPLWTDDDSQDVEKIWEGEQPHIHADMAGWQCLGSTFSCRCFCSISLHL